MPSRPGDKFDYFLSRRGSASAVAREVCEVLAEKGYSVFVQDYDIALGASFVEAMHEAIQASRDLVVLFTRDYQTSAYTRKEFTSFEAQRLQDPEKRRIVVLRCDDVPLAGLLADKHNNGGGGSLSRNSLRGIPVEVAPTAFLNSLP